MQGNGGEVRYGTLVRTCTEITWNRSWK